MHESDRIFDHLTCNVCVGILFDLGAGNACEHIPTPAKPPTGVNRTQYLITRRVRFVWEFYANWVQAEPANIFRRRQSRRRPGIQEWSL